MCGRFGLAVPRKVTPVACQSQVGWLLPACKGFCACIVLLTASAAAPEDSLSLSEEEVVEAALDGQEASESGESEESGSEA